MKSFLKICNLLALCIQICHNHIRSKNIDICETRWLPEKVTGVLQTPIKVIYDEGVMVWINVKKDINSETLCLDYCS